MAVTINIPSQVKTYANLAAFPATGALKTIYIAEDTNKTYRWTGSVYTEISASAAMTWGAIGGTLSNQTDLQNALDAKVPTSRTLTINGVTQDLSANRTFTISTGITIGSTAIASGVVGRVLFEGAGNVVQESSSLFWDNTNNRLGIGTDTPAHTFQVYRNTSAGYLASFNSGATLNTNASLTIRIENANLPSIQALSPGAGGFNTFAINPLGGNLLIGTTTDAGFRLDVNGTARVQSTLGVNGSVTANTASSGTGYEGYKIQDGANARFVAERLITNFLGIGHNSVSGRWDDVLLGSAQRLYFYTGASERMRIFSTGNIGINTTTDAGFRLDVNGTARVSPIGTPSGTLYITAHGTYVNRGRLSVGGSGDGANTQSGLNFSANSGTGKTYIDGWNDGGSNQYDIVIGSVGSRIQFGTDSASIASAQVTINSTTRGFLPPRMTTTQKNAIATPAAGLVVYDTTLNKLCVYTTAWETVTSL